MSTLVLERFITTPEATFGFLVVGPYGFFTQEPPMHLCVPSGRYPVQEIIEGGRTYAVQNGEYSFTVASRPTDDPGSRLFLGSMLGARSNGLRGQSHIDGKRFVLCQMKDAFLLFLRKMKKIQNPEIVIRWLGEG